MRVTRRSYRCLLNSQSWPVCLDFKITPRCHSQKHTYQWDSVVCRITQLAPAQESPAEDDGEMGTRGCKQLSKITRTRQMPCSWLSEKKKNVDFWTLLTSVRQRAFVISRMYQNKNKDTLGVLPFKPHFCTLITLTEMALSHFSVVSKCHREMQFEL